MQGFWAGEVKQGEGPLAGNNGSEPRVGGVVLSFFSLEKARVWAAGGLSLPIIREVHQQLLTEALWVM